MPQPGPREVLIRVAAAGVNRPDLMQREGKYPPPPGASDIPGLEVSGTVIACGNKVARWREGDTVCALVSGGGYAEYCVAPDVQCLPIPSTVDIVSAGAIPERYTVWTNVFERGRLREWRNVSRPRKRAASALQRSRWRAPSARECSPRLGSATNARRVSVLSRTRNQLSDGGFFGGLDGVDRRAAVST